MVDHDTLRMSPSLRVGIVGLGLIGGSLARRLALAENCQVVAWNRYDDDRSVIYEEAEREGITCVSTIEQLAACVPDIIVLANSLASMPMVLSQLASCLHRDHTTICDVGSVKAQVRQQVKQAGLSDCYVGAHPMAGSEHSGWRYSSAALLDHALWAVTIDSQTKACYVAKIVQMIVSLCENRAILLNDDTHDQAAALISHMPHVVATALANMLCAHDEREIALMMAAGSWRDMTRVALTDPRRTEAMVVEDRMNVAQLLATLIDELSLIQRALQHGDQTECDRFFVRADAWRSEQCRQRNVLSGALRERHSTPRLVPFAQLNDDWRNRMLNFARNGEVITGMCETGLWLTSCRVGARGEQ